MPGQKHKNILVAPLDWGLGHTSRCVPVIRHLQASGHKVVFAGNEWQIDFIYKTFPGIETAFLDGYDVSYSRHGRGFITAILLQLPGILSTIHKEHNWLINICNHHHFDGIISDNRYGLYHPSIPSVIMTHQLHVQTGKGKLADNIFAWLHYKMLQRFSTCWAVDLAGDPDLSGSLAHPDSLPRNTSYLGLLSQFDVAKDQEQEKHLLVLLSGPEPQRSILSALLWQQAKVHTRKVVFVEGSNAVTEPEQIPEHITYHKQLTREALQPLIANASIVICRSGYSSIMDLVALNKKAILIPTPGQTEQEYLAKHLQQSGMFYSAVQKGFNLEKTLRNATSFPFTKPDLSTAFTQHKQVIDDWLLSLPGQ
ncbi:MAG: glycosyl transferase family 28 [Bacteroidetes bacterium]|nr:glycosyl transferase family 28 [Bacteroidota bacterium]